MTLYKDYLNVAKKNNIILFLNENDLPRTKKDLILVKCTICNYEWKTNYNRMYNGTGCKKCYLNRMKEKQRKHHLKDYFELAKSKNFTLIDIEKTKTIPKNTDTFTTVKCNICNYNWQTSFYKMKLYGCPKCNKRAKITYEDYLILEKQKDIKFLDITKNNIPKKSIVETNVKCNICNHIWKASYNRILICVRGCPNCVKNKRLTLEDFFKIEKDKKVKFINLNKNNIPKSNEKTLCKCQICKYKWKSKYDAIKKYNCPNCSNSGLPITIEKYLEMEKRKDVKFICIDENFSIPKNATTETEIICNKCGKVSKRSYRRLNSFTFGCLCQTNNKKITKKEILNNIKHKNISLIKYEKYNYLPFTWECNKCKYTWTATFKNIRNKIYVCPKCNKNKLKGENLCRAVFNFIFDKKFIKIRPEWLRYKRCLELDGYCEELNIAFEYNGKQHYEVTIFNNEKKLEKQKLRDDFKIKNCKKQKVKLVIIKQFTSYEFEYIKNKILLALKEQAIDFDEYKLNIIKKLI